MAATSPCAATVVTENLVLKSPVFLPSWKISTASAAPTSTVEPAAATPLGCAVSFDEVPVQTGNVSGVALALDLFRGARGSLPAADATLKASSPESLLAIRSGLAQRGDTLLVALNHLSGLGVTLDKVVQIATERQTDKQVVAAARRPNDANLVVTDSVGTLLAESPALCGLARLNIPDLDHATLVLTLANLALGLTSLTIVEPDLAVCTHTDQVRTIRAKAHAVDIVGVLVTNAGVELEGCAVVEDQLLIVTRGRSAERPLLPDRDRVDLLRVAVNFTDGVSTVPGNAVSVALLSVTDSNDALRVTVPSQVIDPAVDNAVVALGNTLSNTVPHSHSTGSITASNIESRGGEARDGGLSLVFGVLSSDCGVVDRADEDGFVRLQD
ncbi:uncharacterized protein N7496_012587 [Penicillium cataractarum]|uniref:Uncharacterized protein n=1 Tax=Penicillium cataractarum TaxID=2100454 RepID=A0A9W9UTY5_9EURO|nr:uncharacterized protein N7496_012587 [Penicillium cataractarum]KAJ5355375.1 hypothetical protein N7496_012587 [Penicillium cataractarum]